MLQTKGCKMKHCLLTIFILLLVFFNSLSVDAYIGKFKYVDQGGIFTNTSTPVDTAKAVNDESEINLRQIF